MPELAASLALADFTPRPVYLTRRCSTCGRDLLVKIGHTLAGGHEVLQFAPECSHWGIPAKDDEKE